MRCIIMAKQAFTSDKYQAVIRVINRALAQGVHNDDLRKHVMKTFRPDHPGGNEGVLDGIRMTAKGLSTYVANVKTEFGLNKDTVARPVATVIKRDTKVRSVCQVKDNIVTKVCYTELDDLMDKDLKDLVVLYGYQICGAPIGTVIDTEVQLAPEQQLTLKAVKTK